MSVIIFSVLPEHTPGSSMQQTGGDYVYGSMKPESEILPCGNTLVQTGNNSNISSGGTVMSSQLRLFIYFFFSNF